MANEITIGSSLSVTKSALYATSLPGTTSFKATMDGDALEVSTPSIGFAADEALDFGEVTATGDVAVLYIRNNDATNYVELSYDTGGSFGAKKFATLLAGESIVFRPKSDTIYAQADTAACVCTVIAIQGTQYT